MFDRPLEETLSARQLMELKANALFTYDARGRMIGSNEPEPERAPRLFLGRTTEGLIWRVRDDLSDEMVAEIERIVAEEPALSDPQARPTRFEALCELLTSESSLTNTWEGPAWRFPAVLQQSADVVAIGPENFALIREHFPYTAQYAREREPCYAVLEDGVAVSVCYSSRSTPAAAEAGINTLDACRGRGYAPRVAAAWALAVRRAGRVPIYSTSWDNVASQGVARKLGLVLFGAEMSLT